MNGSFGVGLFMIGGSLAGVAIVLLLARWADRRRGIRPEESRTTGLMSAPGSPPASFGDFRHLPDNEPLESPYTIDRTPGAKVE